MKSDEAMERVNIRQRQIEFEIFTSVVHMQVGIDIFIFFGRGIFCRLLWLGHFSIFS